MCLCFISEDINALRTILLYHINNGIFIGGGLEPGVTNLLKSLQGSNLKIIVVGILCIQMETIYLNLLNLIPQINPFFFFFLNLIIKS